MCEDCHQEYCCVHGRGPLRFWGLGRVSYPRCKSGPWHAAALGPSLPPSRTPFERRELLEEQRAALTQRLKWLEVQLQGLPP